MTPSGALLRHLGPVKFPFGPPNRNALTLQRERLASYLDIGPVIEEIVSLPLFNILPEIDRNFFSTVPHVLPFNRTGFKSRLVLRSHENNIKSSSIRHARELAISCRDGQFMGRLVPAESDRGVLSLSVDIVVAVFVGGKPEIDARINMKSDVAIGF